jgi:hypothetical protein
MYYEQVEKFAIRPQTTPITNYVTLQNHQQQRLKCPHHNNPGMKSRRTVRITKDNGIKPRHRI